MGFGILTLKYSVEKIEILFVWEIRSTRWHFSWRRIESLFNKIEAATYKESSFRMFFRDIGIIKHRWFNPIKVIVVHHNI